MRGGRSGKFQGGFIPKGRGSGGGDAKPPYKPCSICGGKQCYGHLLNKSSTSPNSRVDAPGR
eukprot:1966397-Rhodomonas_salina.1